MNGIDPIRTIIEDRERARAAGDPLAELSFLATVTEAGGAAVRTLVLREIRANRFTLFLSRTSPKWRELNDRGQYQLMLYYPSVGRQYRLSGDFEELDRSRLLPHWHQRPDISKYLDHLYAEGAPQSTPVESREWLMARIDEMRTRQPDPGALDASAAATGIECIVTSIDHLDLASAGELHDRRLYTLEEGVWRLQTLVP